MPRQMPVTCEHGSYVCTRCMEGLTDDTREFIARAWVENHPAEAVAQLIADRVLVEVGRGCHHDPPHLYQLGDSPGAGMSRIYQLNLPTEEDGDGD